MFKVEGERPLKGYRFLSVVANFKIGGLVSYRIRVIKTILWN